LLYPGAVVVYPYFNAFTVGPVGYSYDTAAGKFLSGSAVVGGGKYVGIISLAAGCLRPAGRRIMSGFAGAKSRRDELFEFLYQLDNSPGCYKGVGNGR